MLVTSRFLFDVPKVEWSIDYCLAIETSSLSDAALGFLGDIDFDKLRHDIDRYFASKYLEALEDSWTEGTLSFIPDSSPDFCEDFSFLFLIPSSERSENDTINYEEIIGAMATEARIKIGNAGSVPVTGIRLSSENFQSVPYPSVPFWAVDFFPPSGELQPGNSITLTMRSETGNLINPYYENSDISINWNREEVLSRTSIERGLLFIAGLVLVAVLRGIGESKGSS